MYKKLDEEFYVENALLAQLQRLGWEIYRQNKDDPEQAWPILSFNDKNEPRYGEVVRLRETFRKIILEGDLKKSLKTINPWIEDDQINDVIRRIITPQANSLFEANREIHELLIENMSVSENRKTGEKSPTVRYIDFKRSVNNSFLAISQFKVNIPGTEKHIIPDIVLFVNGLPLVVIECKSPAIADPISEAITQLWRYANKRGEKEGNEKLFWYNLFMIATSNQTAKYSTITGEHEHFVEWKDPYPFALSDIGAAGNLTSQQVLVQGMLSQDNLLDILYNFTIFREDHKGEIIKLTPRYQQFRAVKKIIKRLKEKTDPKDKGGIIWHTQGSGKSLTMMFTVRAMYHDPELAKYKIVFVTDRKDLERQLKETSKSVGFTINLASSINEFKELLKTNTPDLVMGMIHKFQERELRTEFPVLNTSPNILIMIDEAHRTEYSLLGANLRKALPNATKIAYTGTPIEKTEMTFGDYIDRYGIKQSVEDGVTVEIVYEGRVHSAELTNDGAANAKFEDVFAQVGPEEKERLLGSYTWRAYLEDQEVIRDKARDMIDHYVEHVFPNGFKAQVVAVSRLAAIRYKQALEEALREKIEKLRREGSRGIDMALLERLKVAVIISGLPNDPPEYHDYTDPNLHEGLIKSFKLPFGKTAEGGINGDIGIIVVQSMLITGFDAPLEQVMYLDNVIKEHNLLQAIARVNRVYENKSCGFVVDYVGVLKHLKEALAIYADEDIEEISQIIINKAKGFDQLEYVHNQIESFFGSYGVSEWRNNLEECIDLLVDEETRNEFISLVRNFEKLMDAVLPDPQALKYVTDLKIIEFIKESARNRFRDDKLSLKDASKKIREIVEEFLISKGVNPKVAPLPLLDDAFIKQVKERTAKARALELEFATKDYIEKHFEEDPEFYQRFSDKLNSILEEYKNNWEKLAAELEIIRDKLKKGREAEQTFGFDPKKEMPFFGLLKQEIYGKDSIDQLSQEDLSFLIDLTRDIIEIVKKEIRSVDFWENYTKQKRLKSYLISHFLNLVAKYHRGDRTDEEPEPGWGSKIQGKRNEIAQKLLELAYYIYGKKNA